MQSVFLVTHLRENPDEEEHVKLIGVYSTQELAEKAVEQLRDIPGFRKFPDGFFIDLYEINETHWTSGFGFEE